MKERIITGLILIGVVVAIGIIDNFYLTWLFLWGVYLVAIYESLKLYQLPLEANFYSIAFVLWVSAGFVESCINLLLILGATFLALLSYYPKKIEERYFLPFLYPTTPFLAILELYKDFGMGIISWLIVVVALTDTMAYFVGKGIGKTKFSSISPKKTLEGVAGGVTFATIGGVLFGYEIFDFETLYLILISALVSIFSVFGDLFESLLKRRANVKDSGNLLPGHGGVLDRVDGYMLSSMILFAILHW